MNILIIDNGSKYLDKLQSLASNHSCTTRKYSRIEKEDEAVYDLIILSGGHTFSAIGHEREFEQEMNLIKKTHTPIIGICLGFELIAHTYGATMIRIEAKEKGVLEIYKDREDQIFNKISSMQVFESHRWVVTTPGKMLLSLARSKDGIEIIKHTEKLIYGFQFHPEMFTQQTQGDELFANFIKIVQNKTI